MVALVVDATKTLGADGTIVMTPLAEQWQTSFPQTFADAKSWVETQAGPDVWESFLLPVLSLPTWLLFGLIGVLLFWLGRRRQRAEVYIN